MQKVFQPWPALVAWLLSNALLAAALPAAAQTPAQDTGPSPTLSGLVRETLDENPGVQAARAAVEAAQARLRGADRPLYNPELEVDVEQAESRSGTLGLNQTIDWADKRGARAGVAQAELGSRRAALDVARQELAGELLAALGRYQTARSRHELAQRRAALMQRFRDLAEKRRRAGDLNQVELDLARLAATQAELQQAQAGADVAEAAQGLAAVVGARRADWPELPQDLPVVDDFDADAILAGLPALRAQQQRVAAARSTVTLRTRERRPDPTVGLRAGQESGFRGNNDDSYGVVGLSLNVPLFVRNTFQAEVDAANAELIQAERELQDLYRRARARLLSAAERYRLARDAWAVWERTGQPSIESQVALLERIWRAGELSTADYLVQLNQTLDTRAEALAVRGRLWGAWFDWLVASGRIDDWLGLGRATR